MGLAELSDTLIISTIEKERNSIPIIQTKMEAHLNALKERTTVTDNTITFKTINTFSGKGMGYRKSNHILLRIYKEGKIVIDKEGKKLKITWTVKLDTLYVLAIFSSIVAGITASLYLNTEPAFSVGIGIAFFLMFIFLGILLIKYKMNDLIYASVYP